MLKKIVCRTCILTALVLIISMPYGCKKSALSEVVPYIEIKDNPKVSKTGIEVTTSITNNTNHSITRYGYFWAVPGKGFVSSHSLSADGFNDKEFKLLIDYALPKDDTVRFRAFIETSNAQRIFSLPMEIAAKGSLPPVIENYFPKKGSTGDTLYIQGERFPNSYLLTGHFYRNAVVSFGNINTRIIESTYNQMTFLVPILYTHNTNVFDITLTILDETYDIGQFEYVE